MKFAYIIGGLGGAALAWLDKIPVVVWGLCGLMVVDFITGIAAAACATKTINSNTGFRGIVKKSIMLLLVAAAWISAAILPVEIPLGGMVAGAFCINELISIVENAARAGISIPKPLAEALEKLKASQNT